jgi:UDP-N-acetylglucosamine:LPS N-acetylglucosamine transferase
MLFKSEAKQSLGLYIFFAMQSFLVHSPALVANDGSREVITQKKKIILFTSKGGAGHMIACNALNKILSDDYEIKIVNPFEEITQSFDIVCSITRKKMDGENLYNYMLANGWIRTTNFMAQAFAPFLLRRNRPAMQKLMYDFFHRERPDMIISAIPYLNLPASDAAQMLDIPYLIVTLDGCIDNWGCMMRRHIHKNIQWTIGIDVPSTRGLLNKLGFADKNIKFTGYPVRDDFNEKKDVQKIKQEWKILDNKFVVMVSMGGAGGKATLKYVQKMYKQNLPIHVLACIGRNKEVGDCLELLQKKNHHSKMSLTIVPFTTRISDLMAASQLLITKPGPGTINEALNMDLPMFLDWTGPTLFWERANVDFVVSNNFGKVIYTTQQLHGFLERCVTDNAYYQDMKQAVSTYKKQPFADNIKPIIFSMCPPHQTR